MLGAKLDVRPFFERMCRELMGIEDDGRTESRRDGQCDGVVGDDESRSRPSGPALIRVDGEVDRPAVPIDLRERRPVEPVEVEKLKS